GHGRGTQCSEVLKSKPKHLKSRNDSGYQGQLTVMAYYITFCNCSSFPRTHESTPQVVDWKNDSWYKSLGDKSQNFEWLL
ncbi:hypothetical protein HAX54_026496, partial [Datura stramonium]|nr:hypothetical protein [Datura stramonium]